MSENCNHNCDSCEKDCKEDKKSFLEKTHTLSNIKKVIGVVSGKGGVGKSLVTSLLTVLTSRQNMRCGIIDADITGPSIPKLFGLTNKIMCDETGIYPVTTRTGIKVVSANLLFDDETQPVVWRGPVISGLVKQFWTDVIWEDIDYMYVDMPPGTGDVPLTVFQSYKLDGIIIVTSPQQLVSMIVEKAINMASMMNIPIIGIVENYSYIKCPNCNTEIKLFGNSNIENVAKTHNLKILGKIPLDTQIATLCDNGCAEDITADFLKPALDEILSLK